MKRPAEKHAAHESFRCNVGFVKKKKEKAWKSVSTGREAPSGDSSSTSSVSLVGLLARREEEGGPLKLRMTSAQWIPSLEEGETDVVSIA